MPGPQQESIYREKVPAWLKPRADAPTETDQIVNAALARGLDELVDPRPAPIAAKANRNVYGPFDTHWNGSGAYVAYRELMTRIARDFADLQPFEQSHFTPSQPQITPKGLSLLLGIADFVKDRSFSTRRSRCTTTTVRHI